MDTLKSKTYDINFVESFEKIFQIIFEAHPKANFALFLDNNIARIHIKKLEEIFEAHKKQFCSFVFEGGEMHKTRQQKEKAENLLFENKFSRQDILISIGKSNSISSIKVVELLAISQDMWPQPSFEESNLFRLLNISQVIK